MKISLKDYTFKSATHLLSIQTHVVSVNAAEETYLFGSFRRGMDFVSKISI